MGKCKVSDLWLSRLDATGKPYGVWLIKESNIVVKCKFCSSSINVMHNGFKAIVEHEKTNLHNRNVKLNVSQSHLHLASKDVVEIKSTAVVKDVIANRGLILEQQVLEAEVLWVLKCVQSNISAVSSDGINAVFYKMFPSEISKEFSLGRTKLGYILTHGLGPYSYKQKLEDIGNSYYSLCFDETTNTESQKELQIRIRYWSEARKCVVTTHLETFFLGTATAEIICSCIDEALNHAGLSKSKLLMLGADGPNVNKKIFTLINESVKLVRQKSLIDIGSCSIHISHNAFLKGLQEFGMDVQDLVIDLYHFFHGWPQRIEDFKKIQEEVGVPQHRFLKHVTSRWLTLYDALERVLEQWPAIKKYFSIFVPKSRPDLSKTNRYQSIRSCLGDTGLKGKIHFVMYSASSFKKLNTVLQTDAPLIHALYDLLEEILKINIFKVLKSTVKIDRFSDDLFNSENLRPLTEIDVGILTNKFFEENKAFGERDKTLFLKAAQKHYIASAKHMIKKFCLQSTFLKYCRYLNPKNVPKSDIRHITYLVNKLPTQIEVNDICDEWNLLKVDQEIDFQTVDLGTFWNDVFEKKYSVVDQHKYPNIKKLVTSCLGLSHGQAESERGFSQSGNMLHESNTQLSCKTLNAKLNVSDLLKKYNNKAEMVPLTNLLLSMCKRAHNQYVAELSSKKKEKEELKKRQRESVEQEEKEKIKKAKLKATKQDIKLLEEKLIEDKKTLDISGRAADTIWNQANKQLNDSLNKGDLEGAMVAKQLLDSYKKLKEDEKEKVKEISVLESKIQKQKDKIVENYVKS